MTERLYYRDPGCVEFRAIVQCALVLPDGRPAAILDRTAFYPTSGGQPFDTGTLGGVRVVDVLDAEDGSIVHVLDGTLEPGPAEGRVDWPRRFDHMQQHTGQHLLSAAFDRLLDVRTVSFHLGSSTSTIDLAREVSEAEIERAEDEANRIVWEDRPVEVRFVDAAEAAALALRKEPARGGLLRLVEVREFDLSACGGTHVPRTGAVGVIAVAGREKFRSGTRLEFVCGARGLRTGRACREAISRSSRLLSVLPDDLPAAIERLLAENRDVRRTLKDQQRRLASFEAAALAESAVACGSWHLVVRALEGWDPNGLKQMASRIAGRPRHAAVLFGLPAPAAVVVARAADIPFDAAAVLRDLTARFGGKGGGRPDLAQGGGLQADARQLEAAARAAVETLAI